MKYREKLGYIALGGFMMLVGMSAAGLFSQIGAEKEVQDADFGTITCRELLVGHNIDSEADIGAITQITPTHIMIGLGEKGKLAALLTASSLAVIDEDGKGVAYIAIDEKSGVVGVHNKDGENKSLTGTGVE